MVPYGTRLPLKFVEFWRYGQTYSCYFVSNFFVEISTSGSTFVEVRKGIRDVCVVTTMP